MYEPPKSKQLPGNPFAAPASAHGDVTQAILALAYEVRTLVMLEHPHVSHDATLSRVNNHD